MKRKVCLNFGCGDDIKESNEHEEWFHADSQEATEIDYSFDFDRFPYDFQDETFDHIYCRNVLQTLDRPFYVLYELHRILKKGGELYIMVGDWHNKGAHSYLQSRYQFNIEAFKNYVDSVNMIDKEDMWEIKSIWREKTWFLKWVPTKILNVLDLFFAGMFQEIHVTLIRK